ncbi:MAG TPA: DNA polymerase III subunit gamma/tau [Patescibacteria group bacterium]|nr:DNA polymerase III subunit gamma/tau [Patescibacteria group bacterium]
MTLYLKYRPTNLDELDLPDVSESLKKIVGSSLIPHAFLFAGPKGTGKTSAARILAKIINCESKNPPCDKCEQCISITKGTNLDVIEMDAASHRGIDDVRTLRDAVKLAPTKAKKKIYIIDEAHMLTTEASNALLKTLEEPPEHVIFILATTNPEKLIDTIRSRTTFISFRKATTQEIINSLKRVVSGEKIKITDESLAKIAAISAGAFRDAIKILEQYALEGEEYLDRYKNSDSSKFINFLVKKDEKSAILEIEKNISSGVSAESFVSELLSSFHQAILAEVGVGENKLQGLNTNDLIKLTELFTEANKSLSDSPIEELPVEIAVIKWCGQQSKSVEVKVKSGGISEKVDTEIPPEPKKVESAPAEEVINLPQETVSPVNDDIWKQILMAVHPINVSIEGLLRSSRPVGYDGKVLTLGVFYKFHKERLEDIHHRKILEDVIEKVLNSKTRIACVLVTPPPKVVVEEAKKEPVLTESAETNIIKAAEEIFGN